MLSEITVLLRVKKIILFCCAIRTFYNLCFEIRNKRIVIQVLHKSHVEVE